MFRVAFSATNNIGVKMDELRTRLRALPEQSAAAIADIVASAITDIFVEEGFPEPWAPLAEATVTRRRRLFGRHRPLEEIISFTAQPLIRTGELEQHLIMDSIQVIRQGTDRSVVVAPTLKRFFPLQLGAPSKNLPARPMLPYGAFGVAVFREAVESAILPALGVQKGKS